MLGAGTGVGVQVLGVYKLAAATFLMSGCTTFGLACTEVGCQGTLTVWLDRALADDVLVTVDDGVGVYECTIGEEYGDFCGLSEVDGQPAITIRTAMTEPPAGYVVTVIEDGGAPAVYDVTPVWSEDVLYPNGEACDEFGCSSGEADLALD